jgi:hypothetical protein
MPNQQTQKSILEETFAEIASIKESLSNNASALLKGDLKSELQNVVAKAINEARGEDFENPESDNAETDDTTPAGGDQAPAFPSDDTDVSGGAEDDVAGGFPPTDASPTGTGDEIPTDDMPPMGGADLGGDEEIVDLTGASDEEVLQVFKKMGPEDEIEVIQTPDGNIELKVGGEEYIIKNLGGASEEGGMPPMEPEMGAEPEMGGEMPPMEPEMGAEPEMGGNPEMGDESNPEETEPDGDADNTETADAFPPKKDGLMAEADYKKELARVKEMGANGGNTSVDKRSDVKSPKTSDIATTGGSNTIKDNKDENYDKRSDVKDPKVTEVATLGKGGENLDTNVTKNYEHGQSDKRTDVKAAPVTADPKVTGGKGALQAGIANAPNYDRGTKSTPVTADPKTGSKTTVGIAESAAQLKAKLDENHDKLVYTRQKYAEAVADNANLRDQITNLNESVKSFTTSEDGYKKAITTLREQFNEVALFTSNLTYTVKLMTEHATTKEEKTQILERFETAKTLGESKVIYESIAASFGAPAKKTVSLDEQINRTAASGASAINESTAYQSPELGRMKELIQKMK